MIQTESNTSKTTTMRPGAATLLQCNTEILVIPDSGRVVHNDTMTTGNDLILYNYFRSSASYRVRIALALKGVKYEYRAVHLINEGGEQHKSEYTSLNPSREVPTLVHNGKAIGQSMAILDYLDQIIPNPRLFPIDPYQRALAFQACEIINSGAQPLGNLRVQKLLVEKYGMLESQKDEWTRHWIQYGLETLEAFLKPYAGKFSFGDDVSAADCFVVPHLFGANRFHVPLEAYSTLRRIRDNCEAIEAFKNASPSRQPDSPKAP